MSCIMVELPYCPLVAWQVPFNVKPKSFSLIDGVNCAVFLVRWQCERDYSGRHASRHNRGLTLRGRGDRRDG